MVRHTMETGDQQGVGIVQGARSGTESSYWMRGHERLVELDRIDEHSWIGHAPVEINPRKVGFPSACNVMTLRTDEFCVRFVRADVTTRGKGSFSIVQSLTPNQEVDIIGRPEMGLRIERIGQGRPLEHEQVDLSS